MLEHIFQISKHSRQDAETLRHNLVAHIFDGILFVFAMSFVSVQTVLPVFVQAVGGGTIAVGSVAVLWTLGINLPQAWFLPLTHRKGPVHPVMLRYALLHRLLFLALGVFTLFVVGKIFAAYTVSIVLFLLFLTAISGSLATPPWFQLFTKTTPVVVRGRLLAFRQMFGSGLGILAGSIVTFILSVLKSPVGFSVLFFIAFAFSMASYVFLARLKEDPGSISYADGHVSNIRVKVIRVLREDKNFRNFLYADALMLMGMTAVGFYAVYGIEKFQLPVASAGIFTAITMASMVAGNVLFGYLGDMYGHKYNLIYLSLAVACASIIAVISQSVFIYGCVFFFMGCSVALQGISRLPLVAEMCSHEDRPIYIALMNTITAPTVFIGIAAGAMINFVGFEIVFLCYGALGLLAAWWLWKRVEEPREVTA